MNMKKKKSNYCGCDILPAGYTDAGNRCKGGRERQPDNRSNRVYGNPHPGGAS